MTKSSTLSFRFLLLLFVFTSVKTMLTKVAACELATRGGGCPDINACIETCRPCYRGVGIVRAFCRPAGGGIPFDECVCSFLKGAPCPPTGPPRCPNPPALVVAVNGTRL